MDDRQKDWHSIIGVSGGNSENKILFFFQNHVVTVLRIEVTNLDKREILSSFHNSAILSVTGILETEPTEIDVTLIGLTTFTWDLVAKSFPP